MSMTQLNGLHDEAKKRFEEQATDLLRSFVTFVEPQHPSPTDFTPDIFKSRTITEKDVIGDIQVSWLNGQDELRALTVAEREGQRTGFTEEGVRRLQDLARAMAKVKPFTKTASLEFLQAQIFEWARERRRHRCGTRCVDFVLGQLSSVAAEHRVLIPVSDLYVESPLVVGSVTIATFPEALLEQLEESRALSALSVEEQMPSPGSVRAMFQGLAAAEACLFGEPIEVIRLATERIELVVGILRFFAPAHLDPKVVSRVARWGYAPQRVAKTFVLGPAGRFSSMAASSIEASGKTVISDELKRVLLEAGLEEVRQIVGRDERSKLEDALLEGMVTFGRAALTPDLGERLVWYCAGLESILLKDGSEAIVQNLAERLAVCAYSTNDERTAAVADVRRAYSLRSGFVHRGAEVRTADREAVARLARHGLRLFMRIAKNTSRYSTKVELIEDVDRLKLSGHPILLA